MSFLVLESLCHVAYQIFGKYNRLKPLNSPVRSKGGIYNTIPFQEIGLPSPELLFDLNFFQMEPEPFYKYAKHLIPKDIQPSLSHYFIAYLESQQKLLRNYTQNFDGLEEIAGVTRYIQTHGSIQTFKCLKCRKKYELNSIIREEIENGHVPLCNSCHGILVLSLSFLSLSSSSPLPFLFHSSFFFHFLSLETINNLFW